MLSRRATSAIEPDPALCLYRVVQEALHDVVRHAHARHARVTLTTAAGMLDLTVVDDGRGFDLTRAGATDASGSSASTSASG
jgi:two-component system sensor histidine kinase UhpB